METISIVSDALSEFVGTEKFANLSTYRGDNCWVPF